MKSIRSLVVALSLVLAAGPAAAGTKDAVLQRGYLQCGVSTGVPGFSHPDDKGNWVGLDVDICRAVAAATLGDASKVKYIPLNSRECFAALQSGEIDLLSRGTTYTLSRDSSLGLDFAGITYYDGQGFLVATKLGATSAADLKGAAICVLAGTTSEANLAAYFRQHKMEVKPVVFDTSPETLKGLETGRCDVLTSDLSQLHGLQLELAHPENYAILPTVISKEPLGPAVRQGDANWSDIVKWTVFALVTAEELGLTSATVDEMVDNPEAAIQRFVGRAGIRGEGLGLKDDWAVQIVRQVGNYGEIFDRNVGKDSPLNIDRGLNNLWNRGGLHYAPPMQ